MSQALIKVVPYDPLWPERFQEEKAQIYQLIGAYLSHIEHIGSTAVLGLAAKPTIDLMVGIRQMTQAQSCITPLNGLGYIYVPEFEQDLPERRYLYKVNPNGDHTHHIHMVEEGTDFWRRHLLFRDALRSHPDMAQAYAQLKIELAQRYAQDREAYTRGKNDFIEGVIRCYL